MDDKALALAMGWGLLSPVSPSNLPEKHASRSATTVSSSSIPFSEEHNGSAGVSSVLEDFRGARNGLEGREWAALWEAMEVLSLPKVTVGAGEEWITHAVQHVLRFRVFREESLLLRIFNSESGLETTTPTSVFER